jgi:hypothetical protein
MVLLENGVMGCLAAGTAMPQCFASAVFSRRRHGGVVTGKSRTPKEHLQSSATDP